MKKELMPATNLLLNHTKLAIMSQLQSFPSSEIISTGASTVIERLQKLHLSAQPLPSKAQSSDPPVQAQAPRSSYLQWDRSQSS
jgi:hypothetical protein